MFARPFALLLLIGCAGGARVGAGTARLDRRRRQETRPARCCPAQPSKPRRPYGRRRIDDDRRATARYRFPSLAPGQLQVTANLQGFVAKEVVDVRVGLGQIKKVDFALPLAGVAETVHGHGRDRRWSTCAERAADQHPRRAGRAAAARPRLHDAGHAGARRQPGSQAGRHLDRRRQRRREPLHHRRHRDHQPAERRCRART